MENCYAPVDHHIDFLLIYWRRRDQVSTTPYLAPSLLTRSTCHLDVFLIRWEELTTMKTHVILVLVN